MRPQFLRRKASRSPQRQSDEGNDITDKPKEKDQGKEKDLGEEKDPGEEKNPGEETERKSNEDYFTTASALYVS